MTRTRRNWTAEEDNALRVAVNNGEYQPYANVLLGISSVYVFNVLTLGSSLTSAPAPMARTREVST